MNTLAEELEVTADCLYVCESGKYSNETNSKRSTVTLL